MVTFAGFTLQFLVKPKSYIWKRVYTRSDTDIKKAALAQKKNAPPAYIPKHLPNRGQLKRIAWELDTRK